MEQLSYYAAAVTTYAVAIISIFFTEAITHSSEIAAVLGFVLLLARLAQELPKAWKALFGKKEFKDDGSG